MAKENIQAAEQADTQSVDIEQKATTVMYTEEQARSIYMEGQKAGYVSAIKQIRSNLNDYLNDLIISAEMNPNK